MNLETGTQVTIGYFGYSIDATVINPNASKFCALVRQDSEFEDSPEDERPTFLADKACIVPLGETAPNPFEAIFADQMSR